MIRILHMVSSLEMGGAQTMIMSIYRMMDKSKIQFDFVVDVEEESCFAEEIKAAGGKIFKLPKFNGRNWKIIQQAWKDFFTKHPEYRILHSHVRSYASIFIPVAKKCGVKTIIHSHNTSNGKGIEAIGKSLLQFPLRFQADYFFGCSEMAGRWLFGERVVQSDRFYMVKNAVDLDRFAFKDSVRNQIREELGADKDTLLLGHIGRFHEQKNHRFLIKLFHELLQRRPNAKLILLGDGELKNDIAQLVQELALSARVIMLGVKDDVEKYMWAMDAVLLPSLHEGLPVVIVEAQASGLTSFVSDAVTHEVGFTDLVHYLPITKGTDPWVEALNQYRPERKDVSAQIEEHGYSVKNSAEWLYGFYSKLSET